MSSTRAQTIADDGLCPLHLGLGATLSVGQLLSCLWARDVAGNVETRLLQVSCPQQTTEVLLQLVGVRSAEVKQNLKAFAVMQLLGLPGVSEEEPVWDPHHSLHLLHELSQVEP